MRRFSSLLPSLALSLAVATAAIAAHAAELPYSQPAFDAALAQGKPVIVDIQADWCPTCRAQKPIVQSLMGDAKRKEVTLFVANFDTEKDLKKRLGVVQQSTFVVFKGGKEVGRSTGQTQKEQIEALFDKVF